MSGTTGTYTSLFAGFPTNGQPGNIGPTQFQNEVATIASLAQTGLTPQMFGAKGDGSTDDTVALQAWASACLVAKCPMVVPPGVYSTTGFIITSSSAGVGNTGGNIQQNTPPIMYGAGMQSSIFRARSGATSPLVTWQNVFQIVIREIGFDCNSLVATALDTSWNVAFGPSLGHKFDHVAVRNFTSATSGGWVATANNDCMFEQCVLDSPSFASSMCLQIDGHGGNLDILGGFYGKLIGYSAQSMQVTNTVTNGFKVINADFNELQIFGGYHYAANGTHINVDIPTGQTAIVTSCAGRWENNTDGGKFIGSTGGAGVLKSAHFYGSRILNTSSGGTPILVDSSITAGAPAAELGKIRLLDCLISLNVTLTAPATFHTDTLDCYDDNTGEIVGVESWRVGRKNYTDYFNNGFKSNDATGWGVMGSCFNQVVSASSGTPGVVTGIPALGMVIVAKANSATPMTQFRYVGATKDTAFSATSGSDSVSAAVSFGSNWQITVTPSNAVAAEYIVTIFGQQ